MTRPLELAEQPLMPMTNDFCAGCGLCCDGTLFGRAALSATEPARLAARGLEVFDHHGQPHFRQPCPLLHIGRCSIYDARPLTCRNFRCKLLKRHEAGGLAPGEGRKRVAEALGLRDMAKSYEPQVVLDGKRQGKWQSLTEDMKAARGEERQMLAERVLALAAFETYLRDWFRDDRI